MRTNCLLDLRLLVFNELLSINVNLEGCLRELIVLVLDQCLSLNVFTVTVLAFHVVFS